MTSLFSLIVVVQQWAHCRENAEACTMQHPCSVEVVDLYANPRAHDCKTVIIHGLIREKTFDLVPLSSESSGSLETHYDVILFPDLAGEPMIITGTFSAVTIWLGGNPSVLIRRAERINRWSR